MNPRPSIAATLPQVTAGTTTGGTALSATGTTAKRYVLVQAAYANTVSVWIGGAAVVVGSGIELAPGDGVPLDLNDPSLVHCVASTGGQKVGGLVI